MAWKLRQMFEGDTVITATNVSVLDSECWANTGPVYVANTIALLVDGVEHILPSLSLAVGGFLLAPVPSGVFIKANSSVQIYAVCEDLPASKSDILTAKPVDFAVTNTPVVNCNNQVVINSSIKEYVRFFLTDFVGSYFNAKLNTVNLTLAEFGYASGTTGNIAVSSGNFSRPSTHGSDAFMISNVSYTPTNRLTVTPASTLYFTARLGYIELIFNTGALSYINYMTASEVDVSLGSYSISDVIDIDSTPTQYIVRKNGTVILTKNKNINYTVTGGTISPSSSQLTTPVIWNLPTSVGTYTFSATVGDNLRFQKSVQVHSCADAINDDFTGVYNTPFSGDVSTNDIKCTGENNYFEQFGTVTGGSVVLNQNGTFTFTPTTDYNSVASFSYRIRCGSDFGSSEIIDAGVVTINYYNICNGTTANWVASGQTRCINCVEEKQEIDLNAQCTLNSPRWVANSGGSACNVIPNLVDTGLKRCQSCVSQKEVQDLNSCSATYQAKSWVSTSEVVCNVTPLWIDNGQLRCNNCTEEKQQRDDRTCSPTYNTTQWVSNPGGTQCNRQSNWTDINEQICVNCVEMKRERDTNLCSPSYNLVRNVANPSGTVCNTEAIWEDTGITRCVDNIHQKEQMSANSCSTENTRWINTGLQVCGCIKFQEFKNNCDPSNPITGVTVYKQGIVEGNRVISVTDHTFTFKADPGIFSYIATVTYQNGKPKIISYPNLNCSPLY